MYSRALFAVSRLPMRTWSLLSSMALLAALVCLMPSTLRAETDGFPPEVQQDIDGAYHISFSSPAIYEWSDEYVLPAGPDGLTISRAVLHHPNGRFVGEGRDFGGFTDVHHDIKGTVKTVRGVTRIDETTTSVGALDGIAEQYRAVTKTEAVITGDAYEAWYASDTVVKFCVWWWDAVLEKFFKSCHKGTFQHTYDYSGVGLWKIVLNPLARIDNDVYGTATIRLEEGSSDPFRRTAEMAVEGKVGRDGIAKLKLTPSGDDGFGSLTLTVLVYGGEDGEEPMLGAIQRVKGKLLGQKFDVVY